MATASTGGEPRRTRTDVGIRHNPEYGYRPIEARKKLVFIFICLYWCYVPIRYPDTSSYPFYCNRSSTASSNEVASSAICCKRGRESRLRVRSEARVIPADLERRTLRGSGELCRPGRSPRPRQAGNSGASTRPTLADVLREALGLRDPRPPRRGRRRHGTGNGVGRGSRREDRGSDAAAAQRRPRRPAL
eukprot:scaffold535_cov260-Pinguiococcus_pyrenoidosus.AAC.30